MEAINAKYRGIGRFGRADWDKLLGHVAAVTDVPAALFGPELMEAYPDAKVVLVEREIEPWYKSWEIMLEAAFNPLLKVLAYTDPVWHGRIFGLGKLWLETQLPTKTFEEAKRDSREMYRKHYAEIRRTTPKEKMLEYALGTGWEPLCQFLGKEVPDVPFPYMNESQSLKMVINAMGMKAIKNSLKNLGMVVSASAAAGFAVYLGVN